MKPRRLILILLLVGALVTMAAFSPKPQSWAEMANNGIHLIIGQNVNMVTGNTFPGGDPYLQRQNEPSIAVSTRNPLHILAGANDYRPVDFPQSEGELPGQEPGVLANNRDAWLGVFKSFNGGQTWTSTLLPGCKYNLYDPGSSPLYGFSAAADPTVRAGANGMFYYSGIAFDRIKNGRSVLFVARFIDNNNLGYINLSSPQAMDIGPIYDSIKYIDTSIIDEGTSGQFADKPWIAVDIPRNDHPAVSISGPDIPEQLIPAHNIYMVYSIFLGSESANTHNKILFARSTNCGSTWETPIKLSEGEHVNQGTTLAISPKDGNIYVAWRRFASNNQTDAILVCKSTDQGQSFSKPIEIPSSYPLEPYDQFTDFNRFRTSAFPTLAVDSNGIVYLAWSDKGLAGYYGRIVMTTSKDGVSWSNPGPILVDTNVGNQIMPSLTYGAGKLMLTWFDTRFSLGGLESPIEDDYDSSGLATQRHTMDVFVAHANPINPSSWSQSLVHTFSDITKVSRYLFSGEVSGGIVLLHQLQSNPPNYPMFMGGTVPFHGDYIDITPAPMFLPASNGMWRFNTGYTGYAGNTGYAQNENEDWMLDPATFHITWTDNRDVKRPDPDRYDLWATYNKPGPNADCDMTGMRDQNVYTSQVSREGIIIGSPGNTKPFTAEDIFDPNTGETIPVAEQDRTFLIFVKNLTDVPTKFFLTLFPPIDPNTNNPALNVSFWQFDPPPPGEEKDEIVVEIGPYSSITLTVFVDCVNESHPYRHASLKVKVEEIGNFIGDEWVPVSNGFAGYVLLNPDPINTAMIDHHFKEIHTPLLESFIPDDLYVSSPYSDLLDIQLYDPDDPEIYDVNPDIIHNPHIRSPHIRSNSLVNPHIRSSNLGDINFGDVYDLQWNFSNDGDTTSAYSFTPFGEQLPELGDPEYVESQLLIYRVYSTPMWGCPPSSLPVLEQDHHELLAKIDNPHIRSVDEAAPHIRSPHIRSNTFFLAPGDNAIVTLRLIKHNPTSPFDPLEYAKNIGGAVTPQAVNTGDSEPAVASSLFIVTKTLNGGIVNDPYINPPLKAFGGTPDYIDDGGTPNDPADDRPVYLGWSIVGSSTGEVLPGVTLSFDGQLTGIPIYDVNVATYPESYTYTYNFIVEVEDNSTPPQTAQKALSITVVCDVHQIDVIAGVGGKVCHSYSGSEECVSVENGPGPATGTAAVLHGDSITFTITPISSCWFVSNVLVDGISILPLLESTYTFDDEGGGVRGDHKIEAYFDVITYTITAATDPPEGGSIVPEDGVLDPEGKATVTCGSSPTFFIVPNDGYRIKDVVVDRETAGKLHLGSDVTEYTFMNVMANHTIDAEFEKLEEWVKRYNNEDVNGDDAASDIVLDASGNVHVTGSSLGRTTGNDFYTISYNPLGDTLFNARYDGPAHEGDVPYAITVDAAGRPVATGMSFRGMPHKHSDYLTVKYNNSNKPDWDVRYDATRNGNDVATAIASHNNFIYVTGRSEDSDSKKSDVLHYDYLTIKYDAGDRGKLIWEARYNNDLLNGADEAKAIAVDNSGNIYVTGRSQGVETGFDIVTIKYLPDGQPDMSWGSDGSGVVRYHGGYGDDEAVAIAVEAGNLYVTGRSQGNGTGFDYVTIKYLPDGQPDMSWGSGGNGVVRYDGGHGDDEAVAIAVEAGNLYVTGRSQGNGTGFDYVTIKYLPDGQPDLNWGPDGSGVVRYHGGYGDDEAVAVAVEAGNLYVTGKSQGRDQNQNISTGFDYYTLKYNNSGMVVWSARYNHDTNADDEAVALAIDRNSEDVYITGRSVGSGTGFDFATVKYKQ